MGIQFAKTTRLRFDKWDFFDFVIKKAILPALFMVGVWRASSFKYLMQTFKSGFGFDTFTGLLEDWDVGTKIEPIERIQAMEAFQNRGGRIY